MKEDINFLLGKRLRELRKKHKLTQQQLAELADIDYKHIQLLEGKNPSSPKLTTIAKVAKAFKITPSKLIDFK